MAEHDESALPSPALFEIGGRVVTAGDVILASDFRGDLNAPWREFLVGLGAEEEGARRGLEPDLANVEEQSDAVRYDLGLLTAEETERWLSARRLVPGDLDAYGRRAYWRERMGDVLPGPGGAWHEAPAGLRERFRADLTLSGEIERQARELARRMAVFEGLPRDARPAAGDVERERQAFLRRNALSEVQVPSRLARSGCAPDTFERLLAMEAAFRSHCAALATPKARDRVRQSMRLPLSRVEVEAVHVASAEAAREATLCIREDGVAMEALAKENGVPYRREEFVLEDLADELQSALISAAPGDVLAPIAGDDGIQVLRLLSKREPEMSDPEVLRRLDREILNSHFADLLARRVRWLLRAKDSA